MFQAGRHAKRRSAALALELLEDRTVPTLLGDSLFPADNPWNQQITNAPVASNSAAIMNAITTQFGNGRLHPDFGQDYQNANDLYGIPYNVVHGNSAAFVHIVIDAYPGESDLQNAPVPANAVIEGDKQNGPTVGVNNRGDSHLIVFDVDNDVAYEFYRASRPSETTDGQWHADQESVWDMKTNTFRTIGWTSADAAGLAILPGLVRPDEALPVSQGGQGVINHAIRFTLQNSVILDQFIYPASHIANPGNTNPGIQPPMGARFRLKASVDISQLNPESKIIAQAMTDYGMIVADNGSNFFFSGASYAVDASNNIALTWNDNDIQDTLHGLKSLHFSDFEVVDLTPTVTGLSTPSGPAGTVVTITGQNFSGAAGHLKVLFGTQTATNVTVLDDTRVRAVAPAGSGTVDVRVQSGVSDPNDSQNIKSPVFGYGTSAISQADQFTYGNGPPTITSDNQTNFLTGAAGSFTVTATGGAPAPIHLSESGSLPAGIAFVDQGNGSALLSGTAGAGTGGVYTLIITAANGDFSASTSQTFTLTVNPSGFSFNASTSTLTISASSFTFTQSTNAGGYTNYTFNADGTVVTLADTTVAHVVVNGKAPATATLITNDTYIGSDGLLHETAEAVTVGNTGGKVQKLDANGNPTDFMALSGFQTEFAVAGPADEGFIVCTPGVSNVFVGAGGYAYMNTGASFYYLAGARYVYGYALSTADFAYQYDGSGSTSYVVSGTAYSMMLGTDNGRNFFNEAVGFTFNEGIAQHSWQDVAYFYDSPGSDLFTGYSLYASMRSADGSFAENDIAANFTTVYAYSFVGGADIAAVYDATVNHVHGFKRIA